MDGKPLSISAAVEGIVDEAVARRLIENAGARPGTIYGRNGKAKLLQSVTRYNEAARLSPWIVLVDLDRDEDCAPPFCSKYLPSVAPLMCFRIAVREVETWLLADRENLAEFLHIPIAAVPSAPETIGDPKQAMVNLARKSRKKAVRDDMVPRVASGRQVGPAYAARLIEFAGDRKRGWHPEIAAKASESLARCMKCLDRLATGRKERVSR